MTALDCLEAATWCRLEPPPRLNVSEWADEHRVLSAESSASPGRWRTAMVEYLREIQDAIGDPQTETIVFMKSAQIGGSEALVNVLLYSLVNDPGPAMYLLPTLELASAFSKDRLQPAIRDCAALRDMVGTPRSRDADNTILRKGVAGAVLTIAGANSPASLSSRPVRLVLADEIDRWPASIGAEGDPLSLAIRRTTAFRRRKILLVSTPTLKGASRIEDWWNVSDQRLYHTPCPRCAEPFVIEWEHLRWDAGDPATARLECPHCAGVIEDRERPAMIAAGQWRASAPFAGIRGYRAWEIVAPWRRLADIVGSFLVAKRSLETRQVWENTCRARLWEAPGESVEPSHLLLRREAYAAELPAGVVAVTCGVDVQDSYLAALVVGWGRGEESWVVHYANLPGDPARPEVWSELEALLLRRWAHELGPTLPVLACCVDSGGHRTQAVYSWVMPRQPRRVHATIGRSGGTHGMLVSPPKPIRPTTGPGTVLLRVVDTDQAKSLLYSRLRLTERAGPEVVHFPMTVGEQFFSELTAERLVTKRNKYGVPTKTWERQQAKNEALDAFALALGALRIVATPARLEEWAKQVAAAAAAAVTHAAPPGEAGLDASTPPAVPTPAARPAVRRVSRSLYLSR
jgi:phage terminase large subunit GpA-like protein